MNRKLALLAAALALSVAAPASQAIPLSFLAQLSGANENPPTGSAGTGTALVTIDVALNTLTFNVTFSGLGTNTTAAHIHCCTTPNLNASVVVPSQASLVGFPLGVTSGTFAATLDTEATSTYRTAFFNGPGGGTGAGAEAALLTGLLNSQAYFNIHTTQFGGGEIRGTLFLVPEPGVLALLGLGLAGLGFARRRIA